MTAEAIVAGAEALAGAVHEGWLGSLAVERADGQDSLASELSAVLTEAGRLAIAAPMRPMPRMPRCLPLTLWPSAMASSQPSSGGRVSSSSTMSDLFRATIRAGTPT